MADMQKLIEGVSVGGKFAAPLTINQHKAQEVWLHCVEQVGNVKKFRVFSHGVEIREVQATKEGSTWVPR